MSEHALLSPSGAKRWLSCTPSARLELEFEDSAGTAAEEGTLAHSMAELVIGRKLGRVIKKVYDQRLADLKTHSLYEPSMFDYCEDYAAFVIEKYNEVRVHTPDAEIHLETKVDLTGLIPEGFGTIDVRIVANDVLIIIDFKYGKGVRVEAEDNEQLKIYGIGGVQLSELDYDIRRVVMIIYQPRIDNIATFELTTTTLMQWGREYLAPRARLAFSGDGSYSPGDHCRFCRAKPVCKSLANYQLEVAKHEFMLADLMNELDIADILKRYDGFINWIESVADYALGEAVKGKQYPGFKLIEGKSNRAYKNENEVVTLLVSKGHNEDDLYNRKIKGVGDMEKELGKADFNRLVEPMLIKPKGKPALAPLSDPRKLYDRNEEAQDDFKNV